MDGENKKFSMQLFLGLTVSSALTLILILIFAIIVKYANLSDGVIKAVNQFIKCISLFLGCFFCVKEGKGLFKGALIGVLYFGFMLILFSVLGGGGFSLATLLDGVLCLTVGGASGIITANVKK